jgi:hypothetical protein
MSRPDRTTHWWAPLCLGIALGLLASFLFPGDRELSKYLWITCILLVIAFVSLQLWQAVKPDRSHRASGATPDRKRTGRPPRKTGTRTSDRRVAAAQSSGRTIGRSAIKERPDRLEKGRTLTQSAENRKIPISKHQTAKKVKLTKVAGDKEGGPTDPVVGYELSPPAVGKSYRIRTVRKTVVMTSAVLEVGPDFVRTRNSYYERQELDENPG